MFLCSSMPMMLHCRLPLLHSSRILFMLPQNSVRLSVCSCPSKSFVMTFSAAPQLYLSRTSHGQVISCVSQTQWLGLVFDMKDGSAPPCQARRFELLGGQPSPPSQGLMGLMFGRFSKCAQAMPGKDRILNFCACLTFASWLASGKRYQDNFF